jgi:hypothetical protein
VLVLEHAGGQMEEGEKRGSKWLGGNDLQNGAR